MRNTQFTERWPVTLLNTPATSASIGPHNTALEMNYIHITAHIF